MRPVTEGAEDECSAALADIDIDGVRGGVDIHAKCGEFIEKPPIDGLCGKTDEDNLGFTYAALDRYIRSGICDDPEAKAKIDRLHAMNLFKLAPLPVYELPEEDFSVYDD